MRAAPARHHDLGVEHRREAVGGIGGAGAAAAKARSAASRCVDLGLTALARGRGGEDEGGEQGEERIMRIG